MGVGCCFEGPGGRLSTCSGRCLPGSSPKRPVRDTWMQSESTAKLEVESTAKSQVEEKESKRQSVRCSPLSGTQHYVPEAGILSPSPFLAAPISVVGTQQDPCPPPSKTSEVFGRENLLNKQL